MPPTREERIRARLFPGVETFARKGFTTLPIILRRAQFLFSPRAWQVYTYILMRTGKAGVAWLTMTEMANDLDFNSTAKLRKYVDQLVQDGWLMTKRSSMREYFLAPDPLPVLRTLDARGKIPDHRREELDELLELLGQEPLRAPPPGAPEGPPEMIQHHGAVYVRQTAPPVKPSAPPRGFRTMEEIAEGWNSMSPGEFERRMRAAGFVRRGGATTEKPSSQDINELLGVTPKAEGQDG